MAGKGICQIALIYFVILRRTIGLKLVIVGKMVDEHVLVTGLI